MIYEFNRELRRNIKGINRFYYLMINDPEEDNIDDASLRDIGLFIASPFVYAVGVIEPFFETTLRGTGKLLSKII